MADQYLGGVIPIGSDNFGINFWVGMGFLLLLGLVLFTYERYFEKEKEEGSK